MTKAERAKEFSLILDQLDVQYRIDDDHDLHILEHSLNYYLIIPDDENDYLKILIPKVWTIHNKRDFARALHACNSVNETIKLAKAFVSEDNVWLTIEFYLTRLEDLGVFIQQYLRVLQASAIVFSKAIQSNDV